MNERTTHKGEKLKMQKKPMNEDLEKRLLEERGVFLAKIVHERIVDTDIPKCYIKKAIEYHLSLAEDSGLFEHHYLIAADLYYEIGDVSSAIRCCKRGGAGFFGSNKEAHCRLARIYKAKGSIRKAIKHYKEAGFIHAAAELAEKNGMVDKAVELYLEGDYKEKAYRVAKDNGWDSNKIAKILGK